MIQSTCTCCGGPVLLPDPPARTQEEKVAFRKKWDADYEAAQANKDPK